ncbi:MAG TPA: M3 family metallopeptidase [Candidatus Baltobacteraceae bacterium]
MTPVLALLIALIWPRDPASVSGACANAATQLKTSVDTVAARNRGYTFSNTVLPLENAVADARDRVSAERFMWAVAQDGVLAGASRDCRLLFGQTMIDVWDNRRLYAALTRVAAHPPHDAFDRALTLMWVDRLKRGGAAADAARHDRYAGYAHDLARVQDSFWRNLAHDRTTIRAGRRTIEVDNGTYEFLRTERDADAREAFYKAYYRRAADANVPLLERAISLRDRMAHALGVESWAEYRLRSTALGGYAQAQQFLASAATAYASGRPPDGVLPWDLAHDDDAPVPPARTIDDALDPVGTAFGLRFTRNAENVWAAGVARYDVNDESTQRLLGTIYVDLVRRPGKQTAQGAYAILSPRGARPGVVAIVASWPGKPGTVTGDRLVDFYRLMGRAIALALPAVPYESLARVSPESQDTVAAVFERFARPDGPPARVMLEQTAIAQIDLAYSSSGSHVDTSAVWQRIAMATFAPLYDAGTYPQAACDEFVAGDAGVLALRPWSQTYAADLYAVLAPGGRVDSSAAERFRRTVLAPAASRRFEDEMRDFLGRDAHAVMP